MEVIPAKGLKEILSFIHHLLPREAHDICTLSNGHEVFRFWDEIETKYPSHEIIENPKLNKYGISIPYF